MLKAKRFNTVNVLIGILIATFALVAAASLSASYAITYGGMRDLLASLYGAGRTARYFNIGLFQSTMRRIRGLSLICAFVAVLLFMLRHRLERWLTPSVTGLVLSFRHLRRTRIAWDPTTIVVLSFITAIAAWLRVAFVEQPIGMTKPQRCWVMRRSQFILDFPYITNPITICFTRCSYT